LGDESPGERAYRTSEISVATLATCVSDIWEGGLGRKIFKPAIDRMNARLGSLENVAAHIQERSVSC